MLTGQRRRIQANLPNSGLITNLPAGAAVEVPCEVDDLGLHPSYVGDLPPQCAALNRNFLSVVELTVRAALEQDPRLVRHAAMLDPHIAAVLEVDQIWSLCDDLVAAHGDLMPDWLRGTPPPREADPMNAPTSEPADPRVLPLADYRPRRAVRTRVTPRERSAVPSVDCHNHLGRWLSPDRSWMAPDVAGLLALMEGVGVRHIVNLDGRWDAELAENLDRYDRA